MIHINRPRTVVLRRVRECPTCERRRRFVLHLYVWYDSRWTCLGCGDSWEAGWRCTRPFKRGWRAEAIAHARAAWRTATPRAESKQAISALLESGI